jgi:hypothetical protein
MGNEANASLLIGTCSFNGTTIAVVKMFSWSEMADFLTVRAQASVGPTERSIYRRDLHASCRVVGYVPPAADNTANSLVFTWYIMDGTTLKTATLSSMKLGTKGLDVNDESPPGEASMEFFHKGSMASSPVAIT